LRTCSRSFVLIDSPLRALLPKVIDCCTVTASGAMGVRLKDVAARAGVSTATVARVIHDNGYSSPEARERVFKAVRESGYRLNTLAQGLRTRRTMTLGHVLNGIVPNPFFAEVAIGVEHAAAERGYNVLIFNARDDADRERAGVETLLARRVDGIIFTTALREQSVRMALDAGVPSVEVERTLCDDAASVVVDNYTGAYAAVEHLIGLGHREIGYLGEPVGPLRGAPDQRIDRVLQERFNAYKDALAVAGAPMRESHLVLGDYAHDPGWADVKTGGDYLTRLLDQAPELTAVFAASDVLAAGALQALYARRLRVPDQMSLVGFDDTFAKHLTPPLTTVRQPMFEMGIRAANLAIDALSEGEAAVLRKESCTAELVVRDSTGPAPGAARRRKTTRAVQP
jgi:DNA-binding LacI/PurR family transcriptional regulator